MKLLGGVLVSFNLQLDTSRINGEDSGNKELSSSGQPELECGNVYRGLSLLLTDMGRPSPL